MRVLGCVRERQDFTPRHPQLASYVPCERQVNEGCALVLAGHAGVSNSIKCSLADLARVQGVRADRDCADALEQQERFADALYSVSPGTGLWP